MVMGKEKKAPPGYLEYEDKVQLRKSIDLECAEYKAKVDSIYNDDYESCNLISKETTKAKNQILRKIKYVKMKDDNLYDFIRKKKSDLLAQREIKDREIKEMLVKRAKDAKRKLEMRT